MTLQFADGRKTFRDFRENVPLAATAGLHLDKDGNLFKKSSTNAYLVVGVPGTVSGRVTARLQYGTMPRTALLEPAIELAGKGSMLATASADFRNARDSGAIFLAKGEPCVVGGNLVQKELARTLHAVSQRGADGFCKSAPSSGGVGAPFLGGKPVGDNRFDGVNDPRRNSGSALGY